MMFGGCAGGPAGPHSEHHERDAYAAPGGQATGRVDPDGPRHRGSSGAALSSRSGHAGSSPRSSGLSWFPGPENTSGDLDQAAVAAPSSQPGDDSTSGVWYEQPDLVSSSVPAQLSISPALTELLPNQCPPELPNECDHNILAKWSQVLANMDVERVLMVTCIPAMPAAETVSVQYPAPAPGEEAVLDTSLPGNANASSAASASGYEPLPVSLFDQEAPPSSLGRAPVVPVRLMLLVPHDACNAR